MRIFLGVICICVATAGCKNEPYETYPLGVISLVNQVSKQTATFRYRNQQLYTYKSVLSGATLANMTFRYQDGLLHHIAHDSIDTLFTRTFIHRTGASVIDSTFRFDTDTTQVILDTTLVSTRTIIYDTDNNPISVELKSWTVDPETEETVFADHLSELTWADGNVTRLITYDLTSGESVTTKDITITHDDKSCVYLRMNEYVYTLSLTDLFWLSKNNPLTFTDDDKETSNAYTYNKLGYPASYQSPTGTTYAMSYTQVR